MRGIATKSDAVAEDVAALSLLELRDMARSSEVTDLAIAACTWYRRGGEDAQPSFRPPLQEE